MGGSLAALRAVGTQAWVAASRSLRAALEAYVADGQG